MPDYDDYAADHLADGWTQDEIEDAYHAELAALLSKGGTDETEY